MRWRRARPTSRPRWPAWCPSWSPAPPAGTERVRPAAPLRRVLDGPRPLPDAPAGGARRGPPLGGRRDARPPRAPLGGSALIAVVGHLAHRGRDHPVRRAEWFARVRRLSQVTVLRLAPPHPGRDRRAAGAARRPRPRSGWTGSTRAARASRSSPSSSPPTSTTTRRCRGCSPTCSTVGSTGSTGPAWAVLTRPSASPNAPSRRSARPGHRPRPPEELTTAAAHPAGTPTRPSVSERAVDLQHPLLAEATRRRLVPGEAAACTDHSPRPSARIRAPPAEVADHWRRAGDRGGDRVAGRGRAHSAAALRVGPVGGALAAGPRAVATGRRQRATPRHPPPAPTSPRSTHSTIVPVGSRGGHERRRRGAAGRGRRRHPGRTPGRAADYRGDREGTAVGLALIDGRSRSSRDCRRAPGTSAPSTSSDSCCRTSGGTTNPSPRSGAAVEGRRGRRSSPAPAPSRHAGLARGHQRGTEDDARPPRAGRALLPEDADPLGDIRSAVMATHVLLICGRTLDEVEQAARPGLEVARAWGIDNVQTMMLSANLATARLRAGRVAGADAVIAVRSDQPPDPNVGRRDPPSRHRHSARARGSGRGPHPLHLRRGD